MPKASFSLAEAPSALPLAGVHLAGGGAGSEALPAADAFAWSLLGLLAFCAICFAASALALRRQSSRTQDRQNSEPDPGQSQPHPKKGPASAAPRQPWEREEDWWKR